MQTNGSQDSIARKGDHPTKTIPGTGAPVVERTDKEFETTEFGVVD